MDKESNIVVTGAAGFIGSCLVSFLNIAGYNHLILVDDFSQKNKEINLKGKKFLQKIERELFFEWLQNEKPKIEFVYHIGARTDTTEFDYSIHEHLNVEYSKKIWMYCSENNIPLVYASSAATYGAGELGYKDDEKVIENLKPLNPYGVSKNEFDKWVLRQAQDDKLRQAQDDKLRQAQDDKLRQAQDDKLRQAQDDKLRQAQDDKLRQAQDDKLRQAQDDKLRQAQDDKLRQAQDDKLRQAQDDKLRQAQDDKLRQAQDDKLRQAQDDKLRQAQDDKLRQAQDDKLRQAQDDKLRQAQDDKLRQAQDDKLRQAQDDKLRQARDHSSAQLKSPPAWAGLKFFNVYGPNEYHKARMASVIFHSYNQIIKNGFVKLFKSHKAEFNDGEQLRDFIYVKDVLKICYWFLACWQKDYKSFISGIYNVGTGEARSFNDLVKATFFAMDLNPEIQYIDMPGDIQNTYQYYTQAEMQKIKIAGYNEKMYSLEEGVDDYIRNYLSKNEYY